MSCDPKLYEFQANQDVLDRIIDLKNTLYAARKRRMSETKAACDFGGHFNGIHASIRVCDIEGYIEYLEQKYGL